MLGGKAKSVPASVNAIAKLWSDSVGPSEMPDDKQGLRIVGAAVDKGRLHCSLECAVTLQSGILQSTGTLSASHNQAENYHSLQIMTGASM